MSEMALDVTGDNINMQSHRLKFIIYLFLIVGTLAVYWQLPSHDFIVFDDDTYVSKNSYVVSGLTKRGFIWAYVRHAGRPGLTRYFPVLLIFILGLMSKPMLVTLPLSCFCWTIGPLADCG